MDLDLFTRTSAILLAAAALAATLRGAAPVHAPSRLASRACGRLTCSDPWTARSQRSNCSKRSRCSKGRVRNCGSNGSGPGTRTEQCPWNSWNHWNPWNRGSSGLVHSLLVTKRLVCLARLESRPEGMVRGSGKARPSHGNRDPRCRPPIASRRQPACGGTLHLDCDAAAVGRRMERRVAAGGAGPRIDAHPPRRSPHAGDRAAGVRDLLVQPAGAGTRRLLSRASGNGPATMKC